MGCSSITLAGLGLGCRDGRGGISEVYIAKKDDVTSIDLDSSTSTSIDTITMGTSKKFKTYKVRKETSSLTSTLNASDANGSLYVSSVLSLQFAKNSTDKRTEVTALTKDDLVVVIRDNNKKLWLLGFDNAVVCTGGTMVSGTAMGDLNGLTLELTDTSDEYPYEVTMSTFMTLVDDAPVTE